MTKALDLKAIRAAAEADLECPIEYWEASISEIQSATLIYLLDRLEAAEAQLAIYEKHGVTCQTFRHKLTGCAECNRDDAVESVNETNAVLAGNYFALLPKLEAAEVEVTEQARLLGISAEKELALMAKLEATEKAKVGECCTRCVVFCQGGSGCHAGVPQISGIEKTRLISEQLERTK